MPASDTACFQVFLDVLSRKFGRQHILLVLDGAPNHRCGVLALPDNISLLFLPPYSPELNPKENLWDEIREKIFKNLALKSMDAVRAKLKQAVLYIERNPESSNPSRPSPTSPSHSDVEVVSDGKEFYATLPKRMALRRLKPTPDKLKGLRGTNQDIYDQLVLGTTITKTLEVE